MALMFTLFSISPRAKARSTWSSGQDLVRSSRDRLTKSVAKSVDHKHMLALCALTMSDSIHEEASIGTTRHLRKPVDDVGSNPSKRRKVWQCNELM